MGKQQNKLLVAKAYTKYIRVSPRKIRLVIDLIRGETATRALAILANINKRAKVHVEKTLRSAISNARQNPTIDPEQLLIARITADQGPTLKRYRAASMGRATMVRHRTTHLMVELVGQQKQPIAKPKREKAQSKRK